MSSVISETLASNYTFINLSVRDTLYLVKFYLYNSTRSVFITNNMIITIIISSSQLINFFSL